MARTCFYATRMRGSAINGRHVEKHMLYTTSLSMESHLLSVKSSSSSPIIIPRFVHRRLSPPHLTISAFLTQDSKTQAQPKAPTNTTTTTTNLTQSVSSKSISSTLPPPSLAATFCRALDEFINQHIDPPHRRPSVDPVNVLSGNFAPVSELPPTHCPTIIGTIPNCLAGGAYIRNGPNPHHLPRGTHHLFDGDGMLHSLLLPTTGSEAPPILSSHYVRTYKYRLECAAGEAVLPNVFSGFHGLAGIARSAVTALRVLTGELDPREGAGLANTSLAFIGNTLYALGEADLPYAVHVSPNSGAVTTAGRSNFNGQLTAGMTAHPKRDPITGEWFAYRCSILPPFLTYFRFSQTGEKTGSDVPIHSIGRPTLLHDFAVTERYVVFPDIQVVMKPLDMLLGRGAIVGAEQNKVTRLGVLPRYAASEREAMRWFDVPEFNIFHVINAWEEGDTIVLIGPNVKPVEHFLERLDLVTCYIEVIRIDLRSGLVTRTELSRGRLDFGVINPNYVGRRNRYAYMAVGCPFPKINGVVKLDFDLGQDCVVARRDFGPGRFGGEPFFVRDGGEAEDDGYLVTYVHDEEIDESRFVVMDARSPELEVVAEVALPQRVPYGFHGLFVSHAELQSQ